MSMQLSHNPSLSELQEYFQRVLTERGFDDESVKDKLVLLMEEIGELARAIRKSEGLAMADDTKRSEAAEEIADCIIYLTDIANKLSIDLPQALRAKEEKNQQREWKKNVS
ncbi:MAG: hypothetical protein H6760_05105 [Candidatus Nomurabacteria bacterium]|nr:MAG: hypothetical protein H6760_05105 [Candidatus Nomurabacteria bacterium]